MTSARQRFLQSRWPELTSSVHFLQTCKEVVLLQEWERDAKLVK